MISPHLPPIQGPQGHSPYQVQPVHATSPPTPLKLGQLYKQVLLSGSQEPVDPPLVERRRTWRTVADIMKREVLTVRTTTTVAELAQFLSHHRISGAPVLDAEGLVAGVVSLADVNSYAAHAWARIPPPDQRLPGSFHENTALTVAMEALDASVEVGKIMSPYVYFATSDSDLLELSDLMVERHIHRLLVLEQDELVGIVTSLDVMRAMRQELG